MAKNNGRWFIAVDGAVWINSFDMVFQPVFSPDSNYVAVKYEQKGKYGIAVNDRLWDGGFDAICDPVFSPAGDKMLLRTLKDGIYTRHVLSVADMLG